MATTAPMPMMMPSIVNPARKGLRRRIRKAESMVSQRKDILVDLVRLVCLVYLVAGKTTRQTKKNQINQTNLLHFTFGPISNPGGNFFPAWASEGSIPTMTASPSFSAPLTISVERESAIPVVTGT